MKLHLPLPLRSSLLACMAAFVGTFSTLSTATLATGTVILALAAAPGASADWAPEGIEYTGDVTIDDTATEPLVVTENSVLHYNYDGGVIGPISADTYDIKLVAKARGTQHNLTGSTVTAHSVWFSQGRYALIATTVQNAGTLYAQGGQIWIRNTSETAIANDIVIGSTTYSENNAALSAAIRFDNNTVISGNISLVEDGAVSVFQDADTATISGAIHTNGFALKKMGTGTLVFDLNKTTSFDKLVMDGGTLHARYLPSEEGGDTGKDNGTFAIGELNVTKNGTIAQLNWNNLWKIDKFVSTNANSSNLVLTLDHTGTHYYRTQYTFDGAETLEDSSLFSGTINLRHTGAPDAGRDGLWQTAINAGTATQLSKARINLGTYTLLAVTAESVTLGGLSSVDANAYVFSGASTNADRNYSADNTDSPKYAMDGVVRTLTLAGSGDASFLGTIAGNLIINKTGTGSQTLGNIGDNVTINLQAGSLTLRGIVGENTTIVTTAGTSVLVPWTLTPNGDITTASYTSAPSYITGQGEVKVGSLFATGSTEDAPTDKAYTAIDPTGYQDAEVTIASGLVGILENGTTTGADFGTIDTFILNGGGLVANAAGTSETFTFDKNLKVTGNGFFRVYGDETNVATAVLTGSMSGAGTFTKTDLGSLILQGDMSGFNGTIAIGKGTLTFNTDAAIHSLAMRNDSQIGVSGGHRVSVNDTLTPHGGETTIRLDGGSDLSLKKFFFYNANVSLQKADGAATGGSLTTQVVSMARDNNNVSNLTVGAGTALNITGADITATQANFISDNPFVINHWGESTVTVNGTLNMLSASSFAVVDPTKETVLTVNDGGVLNMLGIGAKWRDGAKTVQMTVRLESGSMLNLGANGMLANSDANKNTIRPVNLQLVGGSLGILASTASWSGAWALNLQADTVVNTELYTPATDGGAGSYTGKGGTITLSGAITGEGRLVKQGIGTLRLTNVAKLAVNAGYVTATPGATAGTLTIGDLAAMTDGGGRFLINLADNGVSDRVDATTYGNNRINLSLQGGSAGTYSIFDGGTGLTDTSLLDFELFLNRGLELDTTTGVALENGVVKVTLTGTASTDNYDLVWAGEAGETWSNSAVEAWTGPDEAGNRFSVGDRVTFNGGGITDITITGIVTPGAMTVSGDTDYSIVNGRIEGSGALTKEGDSRLTLDTDMSAWTGNVVLNGGTLAFTGALGSGNTITVANNATLAWINGNTADISARLRVGANGRVTFDVEEGTVTFKTAVANNVTYTKTGLGTLKLDGGATRLNGNMIVEEGTLQIAWSNGDNGQTAFKGGIAVKREGVLYLSSMAGLGWGNNRVTTLLLEDGGTARFGAGTTKHTLQGTALTMNGGHIVCEGSGIGLELNQTPVVTIGGSAMSTIEADLMLDNTGSGKANTTFNVADATEGTDLLVTGNVIKNRGTNGLLKTGAGTMEITGNYTAGEITVNAGNLIVRNATMDGVLSIAATDNATLTLAAGGLFRWNFNQADRTVNGRLTLEEGSVLQTRSNWKHSTTLAAGATLAGSGTWVTGLATEASQNDDTRNIYLNGKTAGFTGAIELHGTGGDTETYRTAVYLNSEDGAMNGIVRTVGAAFVEGGWSVADESAIPTLCEIVLQKDMTVGGFEGKGGILKTDVEAGVALTVGNSDAHVFSGSMTGQFNSITKVGSGSQIFDGDLSAAMSSLAGITVSEGRLGLGATAYTGNLTLQGTGSTLSAGSVTVGEGRALTVTATGTVISADLTLSNASVTLGEIAGNYGVSLDGHKLTLSATAKSDLSLVIDESLEAGARIDLFTDIGNLATTGANILGATVADFFNTSNRILAESELQLTGNKLQVVLSRGGNALVYGLGDNGVWAENEAFESEGATFVSGTNVSFSALEGADQTMTVQLKGDLSVGTMVVDAGEGNTYRFIRHADGGTIAESLGIRVNGGTASFAAGTLTPTEAATIMVSNATLALDQGAVNDQITLALADGATLLWNSGNATDYAAGNRLSIADNARVTLDVNGNRVVLGSNGSDGASGSAGHVTLASTVQGGNLILGSGNALHGTLDLGGLAVRLNGGGDAYDLNLTGNGSVIVRGDVTLAGANDFTGALVLGDNADTSGSGSADSPANGTLNVTDTSLGSGVTGIELKANADGAGSTLNYTATVDATLAAPITGTGDVNISGGHEVTLAGANAYTGKTGIGADTTLKVTDATLSATTEIGKAGASGGALYLTNTKADGALDFANKVGDDVTVTVSGGTINWLADANHEKTYTGTTTIAAGTTVTASGSLTTGANSKIVLESADSVLSLDLSSAGLTGRTSGHTVSGAGKLIINAAGQTLAGSELPTLINTNDQALNLLSLTAGTFDITGQAQSNYLKKITTLEIGNGAQLAVRSPGMEAQAGLALSIAGSGTGDADSQTAAALFFGKRGSASARIGSLTRDLALAADATVYVENEVTGTLAGSYASNDHTLTKTGTGTLRFEDAVKAATGDFAVRAGTLEYTGSGAYNHTVALEAGTTLSVYSPTDAGTDATIASVTLNGDATLKTDHFGGTLRVANLNGAGKTLTIDGAASSYAITQYIVLDGGSFSGTVDVKESNNGTRRRLVFGVTDGTLLQNATVKLSQQASADGTLGMVIGGVADGTIELGGLDGIASSWLVSGNTFTKKDSEVADLPADLMDGNERTLQIDGSGDYAFAGSVGAHLAVVMNGSGSQTFSGALADGISFTAEAGALKVSSTDQTGSHTFTAQGGVLDMSGYSRSNAAEGMDSFVYKSGSIDNLALGAGMNLKADDTFAGVVQLGGTTVLDGGVMSFRLSETPVSGSYYGLATSYAIQTDGIISIGDSGATTMLTFIPVDKRLDPSESEDGRDYVLIANVGDTFGADDGVIEKETYHLDFNMSTSGRTNYTLKVVTNQDGTKDLVLNVEGQAAELVWNGDSNAWNNESDNLAWNNGQKSSAFMDDDLVLFGTLANAQTIIIAEGGVRMGGMTVVGTTDYTFNGGAIMSSEGNTAAGLTVGTVDNVEAGTTGETFTGTLTINTANTYAGNTTLNSGAVVAGNARALSDTELTVNGGTLKLAFEGALGVSGVTMNGGAIHADADASISNLTVAGTDAGKTFSAAAGCTLTLTSTSGSLEGALAIGSAADSGVVIFDIATRALATGQDIAVAGGTLRLDGTTGSFNGKTIALDGGHLEVTGGLTATLSGLTGSGSTTINASTLIFSAAADIATAIMTNNATIKAAEGRLTLQDLRMVGSATLTGTITLNGLTQSGDTQIFIGKSEGDSGNVTLGADLASLASVEISKGSLTVKNGDSIGFLTSYGALTTAADTASVSVGDAWIKNGATIDSKIVLTLTGGTRQSWLGDSDEGAKTTLGDVIVDGRDAIVNLGGQVEIASLTIKQGRVETHYNSNTVTGGITVAGTDATLDLHDGNPHLTVALQQGRLERAGNYAGVVNLDDTSAGTAFSMGGLTNAATVVFRNFAQGSTLTDLASIKLGDATFRITQGMQPIFLMTDPATGTVGIADDGAVTFVCGSILQDVLDKGTSSHALTNGSLSGLADGDGFKAGVVFDPTLGLYNVAVSVDGGNLVFTRLNPDDEDNIFQSSKDGTTIDSYAAMDGIAKVNIDVDTTIDLTTATLPEPQKETGLLIKNLHNVGTAQSTLTIRGEADDLATLDNNLSSTYYDGHIVVENARLRVQNTDALGDGSDPSNRELSVLGSLKSTGEIALVDGKLTLAGNGNELGGGLTFNDDAALGEKGLLTLNGTTTLGGVIIGAGGSSADIVAGKGTTVTLEDGASFNAWLAGNNAETLSVAENATVGLGENARVEGVSLHLGENSQTTLMVRNDHLAFNGLSGTGKLLGSGDTRLDLKLNEGATARFEGDLSNFEGTLSVTGEGMQILESSASKTTIAVHNGNLTVRNQSVDAPVTMGQATLTGGTLHFDTRAIDGGGALANSNITLDSLTTRSLMRSSGSNTLVFDMNLTNELTTGSSLVTVTPGNAHIEAGTVISVNVHGIAYDLAFTPGATMSFTLLDGLDGKLSDAERDLTLTGSTSMLKKYFKEVGLAINGSALQLTGQVLQPDEVRYHQDAATTETGRTGGALLDYLFITTNPQVKAPGSLAATVLDAMEDLIDNGRPNTDRVMAGIAGSTVTTLSASFASGLEAQMSSIRDRMTGMGVDQRYVNEDMPYFHAWISANAANTRLDADSTLAGYKLNSAGGTVGVDIDVSDYLTLGAAFTASYGDLTADGAEYANGHLDTYTTAVFARAQVKRWTHNLVLAVSTADGDLDRTVDYGGGSYTAKGTSNGIGFGALYETTFDIHVGEDGEDLLQPLFRASFTHAAIDGYSETGAEALGLNVGKQDISYGTFGLGARYIAAVGENVFNRTATFELRAMILQDAGSRRGEADVALGGAPARTRTVRGAEPGSTGVQVGASLNVPIEESSAIFADFSLDARSKSTSVNGSVGYRIDF